MTDERWDVPSERLGRIAAATNPAYFRECLRCSHRHVKGERCGYPREPDGLACKCQS